MLFNSRDLQQQKARSQAGVFRRQKRFYRPMFECLEARTTPTTFTWTNVGGNGIWENPENWAGGAAGTYPGWNGTAATTDDTAHLAPLVSANVTMQNAHELARLEITNTDIVVTLQGNLTLNNGGLMSGGAVVGSSYFTVSGGSFNWTGGDIGVGSGGGGGQLTVWVGATGAFGFADFRFAANGRSFGANLFVDTFGRVYLENTATITLQNSPTITNYGFIYIPGGATDPNTAGLGGSATWIDNMGGHIWKTGGATTYTITHHLNNNNGELWVGNGQLSFLSVVSQGGSSAIIDILGGTTLATTSGITQASGTFKAALTGSTANVHGHLQVNGGSIVVGSEGFEESLLQLSSTFTFTAGTYQLYSLTGNPNQLPGAGHGGILANGNINITLATTAVAVTFVGGQVRPNRLHVMRSAGNINSRTGGYPPDYVPFIHVNSTYILQKRMPVRMGNVNQQEGNEGTTAFNFPVTLDAPSLLPVKVDYTTADSQATIADNDYLLASGTVTFQPDEITRTITVSLLGDFKYELDELFFVNLSNARYEGTESFPADIADSQGDGTILNDDMQPYLNINSVSQSEGNTGTTTYTFTVSLSNPSSQTITVNYATADDTATTANSDYVAASGNLTFNPGETSKTITVNVNGDTTVEPDEQFKVNLSNGVNASLPLMPGWGTILNDDAANNPPVAQNDTAVTAVNVPVTINVLANDSDLDGDVLTVTSAGPATFGTLVINADNTITFTPNSGYEGPASFPYVIGDGRGGSASASVTVTVGQPQLLEGAPGPGAAALSSADLQPVIAAAIAQLQHAGFGVAPLDLASFVIADLHEPLLGVTHETTIWIDADAAGHGWYIEDVSGGVVSGGPFEGVDLFTVVTHELGHVLGYDSIHPAIRADHWMTATLAAGVRRLPRPLTPDPSPQGGEGNLAQSQDSVVEQVLSGEQRNPDLRVSDLFAFDLFASAQRVPIVDGSLPLAPVLPLLNHSTSDTTPPLAADDFDLAEPMPAGDGEQILLGGAGTQIVIGEEDGMCLVGGFV